MSWPKGKRIPDRGVQFLWEERGIVLRQLKGNEYYYRRSSGLRSYFIKTACTICGATTFQGLANNQKGGRAICRRRACVSAIRTGSNAGNWVGGKRNKHGKQGGHVMIYAPQHPHARQGYIPEHRHVIETEIARVLDPKERVHHIDLDKTNNAVENLLLCTGDSEHNRVHGTLNHCVKTLIARGYLAFDRKTKTYFVPTEN